MDLHHKTSISILVALLPLLLVTSTALRTSGSEGWREYQNLESDIRILYPVHWHLIVAEERSDPGAAWTPTILAKGELHKVTFLQQKDAAWSGQYQIRVLANPDSLDLEPFYARFDPKDIWDNSAADSTIDDHPAKTWVRWSYESLIREFLIMNTVGAVHILYDEANSNDPRFDVHQAIYKEMTSTFRFVQPGTLPQHEKPESP